MGNSAGAGWITQLPSFTIPILVFFFGITSLIYKYITRFSTYGAATEIQFYLGSIVLKLLMGCGFLWAMSMVDRPNVNANAVLFLVSYILYTDRGNCTTDGGEKSVKCLWKIKQKISFSAINQYFCSRF